MASSNTAAAAEAKQQAFVNAVVVGIQAAQTKETKELITAIAGLSVTLNGIQARLDQLESIQNTGAVPKRAVRATGAKGGAKGAAGGKKKAGGAGKVTNARLYSRLMMETDLGGARAKWGTDDNIAKATAGSNTVRSRNPETDGDEYWAALGIALWDCIFTDAQKDTIREEYNAWKADQDRAAEGEQLQEDDDAAASANGDADA